MVRRKRIFYQSLLFMLPAILIVVCVDIIPIFQNFYYSLFSWDILEPSMKFVGLDNFINFFKMDGARGALKNTLIYAVLAAVLKNIVGLALALVLNSGLKTQKFLRTCILSTTMISLVISGYTWTYLYHPEYGVGYLIEKYTGISFLNQDWLGNPKLALYAVLVVSIWQIAGKYMVIYLAGLQTVPKDLYEAGNMDGASGFSRFRYITAPLIIPSFTVGILNAVIQGLKVFDEIYSMTRGGPGFASETLTTMMYSQTFFYSGKAGFGSAISVILFGIVLIVSLLISSYLRKKEDAVYQ